MNKKDFIEKVATKCSLSKADTSKVLEAILESVQDCLVKGEEVQLTGFGSFKVGERNARTGRNPQTGQEIQIPASRVPQFKAGAALKDKVKNA